tara:strand:- start:9902 stop:10981 length:1080 start_codon:yes stop_codon:yes gene_type:complete
MFKFLKKGLKEKLGSFKKKVEEEGVVEESPKIVEEEPPKKALLEEKEVKGKTFEMYDEEKHEEIIKHETYGVLGKIKKSVSSKKINEKQFEEFFWDLEVMLLENGVAVEVIEKIKQGLKVDLVDVPLDRGKIEEIIQKSLRKSLEDVYSVQGFDLLERAKEKKPLVVVLLGVNGSGKTSTIGKLVQMYKDNGKSCVVGAADTFRAGSEEQLKIHADKLDVKMIKHQYGADPAAVAFDTKKYAESHFIDVALVDTAGRLHSNANLMDELKKIVRVVEPDLKIFVGEAIAGNDVVEQVKEFDGAVGVDGIILNKLDVDEKGGSALSVSYVTGKPILYFGVGQGYKDLEKFSVEKMEKMLEI